MLASPCNSTASTLPSSLDMSLISPSASPSASTAAVSPPVSRPDSPRLPLRDPHAVTRARLHQLAVWSDAAEEQRDDDADTHVHLPDRHHPQHPAPVRTRTPPQDRLADRQTCPGLVRRKSFFCGRLASGPASSGLTSGFASFYAPPGAYRSGNSFRQTRQSCYGPDAFAAMASSARRDGVTALQRGKSFRRGKSFHRYNRVKGSLTDFVEPIKDDFDDLATKVTEVPVPAVADISVHPAARLPVSAVPEIPVQPLGRMPVSSDA